MSTLQIVVKKKSQKISKKMQKWSKNAKNWANLEKNAKLQNDKKKKTAMRKIKNIKMFKKRKKKCAKNLHFLEI